MGVESVEEQTCATLNAELGVQRQGPRTFIVQNGEHLLHGETLKAHWRSSEIALTLRWELTNGWRAPVTSPDSETKAGEALHRKTVQIPISQRLHSSQGVPYC